MDIGKLKIDKSRVEGGDWVDDLPNAEGLRLRVRGIGSSRYRDAVNRRSRGVPRSSRNRDGTLSSELSDKITGEAAAEALLLDWQGLTEDGVEIPYDRDRALKLLTEPDYSVFRDLVLFAASIVAEDDVDAEAKRLGNSAPPSGGGSSGEIAPPT